MGNIEKDIAERILSASGLRAAALGLRFDRVVVRVLGDLRAFAEARTPAGAAVVVSITAPIRLPARTVEDIEDAIASLLVAGGRQGDLSASFRGNGVRLRLVEQAGDGAPRLIGFVHNPGSSAEALLDLAEHWLRARG